MSRILLVAIVCFVCTTSCYAYVGYRYVGCFEDKGVRILDEAQISGSMTVEKCVQYCSYNGHYFAGVEYANQCYCGKYLKQYNQLDESQCSTKCGGDSSQICGGTWKISVYTTNENYLGCYVDAGIRMLEGPMTSSDHMTTEYCINYCKTFGKRFALTQYSKQCFCGNHLRPYDPTKNTEHYQKRPDSECNFKCEGAKSEMCGGFWRGSLYVI